MGGAVGRAARRRTGDKMGYREEIRAQHARAMWEVGNVLDCVPDAIWVKEYCGMPLYKHVYHMLHSLDQWFVNPMRYEEPAFHAENLNNLDVPTARTLTRAQMKGYLRQIEEKLGAYLNSLSEEDLLMRPEGCRWTRFALFLGQYRHLCTHMGMLMGFVVAETSLWPRVVGLTGEMHERSGPEYM